MQRIFQKTALVLVCLAFCTAAAGQIGSYVKLNLVCSPTNDLYRLLVTAGQPVERFETPQEAVEALGQGSSLFVLADTYPYKPIELSEDLIDKMSGKDLSAYIEFVGSWPYGTGEYSIKGGRREAVNMRAVVVGGGLAPYVKANTLLSLHKCTFMPLPYYPPILAIGEIPGYTSASGNLPKWTHPRSARNEYFTLLGRSSLGKFVLAGTKLSHLVTGRYEPSGEWRLVWQGIIKMVTGEDVELPPVTSLTKPSFTREEELPEGFQSEALRKATDWYLESKLLVHPERPVDTQGQLQPWPGANVPVGNGQLGILEGFASAIEPSGYNMFNFAVKKHTVAESALALALGGKCLKDTRKEEVAGNLLNFFFDNAPKNAGDDAATLDVSDSAGRALIAAAAAASLLNDGERKNALAQSLTPLLAGAKNGARPGDSAYLWAYALWAYRQTGETAFFDFAKKGLAAAMESYGAERGWGPGIQQERARILLPLAWLVRVEDEQLHREWLRKVCEDLLALQDASGAIGEASAVKPEPREESSSSLLISENGDKAADFLYTINFALLGLHEAFKTTGDSYYEDGSEKLAGFVCRVQVKSILHPELNGSWFRGFDYGHWRYWGGDVSPRLGAWSVTAGQSQAWISAVLAMRELDTSLWDILSQAGLPASEDVKAAQGQT